MLDPRGPGDVVRRIGRLAGLGKVAGPDAARLDLNTSAQKRYRKGLAELIRPAHPTLTPSECARRAADVDVVQNGLWLTALSGLDRASIRRALQCCEEIAFAPVD